MCVFKTLTSGLWPKPTLRTCNLSRSPHITLCITRARISTRSPLFLSSFFAVASGSSFPVCDNCNWSKSASCASWRKMVATKVRWSTVVEVRLLERNNKNKKQIQKLKQTEKFNNEKTKYTFIYTCVYNIVKTFKQKKDDVLGTMFCIMGENGV